MVKKIFAAVSLSVLVAAAGFAVFTMHAQTNMPPVPQWVSAKAISACTVHLNWKESAPADYFVKSANTTPDFDANALKIENVSCTSASDCANLEYDDIYRNPGTSYYYALKAGRTVGGESAWTAETPRVTTPDVQKPETPKALLGTWNESGQLQLSWTPVTLKNGGYRLLVQSGGGKKYAALVNGTFPYDPNGISPLPFLINVSSSSVHSYKVESYQTDDGCYTADITDTTDGVAKFSDPSSELVVPAAPQNLTALSSQTDSVWEIVFSWDKAEGAERYELQIASDQAFTNFDGKNVLDVVTTGLSSTQTFAANVSVYYRVRAINRSNGNEGFSAYTVSLDAASTGVPRPEDLTATVTKGPNPAGGPPVASESAEIVLSWRNKASVPKRSYEIYQSVDGAAYTLLDTLESTAGGTTPPPTTYTVENVPTGYNYDYKVRVTSPEGSSDYSNIASVVLKFGNATAILGEGWGAYHYSADVTSGVGWIKLGGKTMTGDVFGVWMDDDGYLHGAAWANVVSPSGKESYGWLSFNSNHNNLDGRSDLAGCPGGDCTAKVTNGVVGGWARFIFAKASDAAGSSWDGWVSLRGTMPDGKGGTTPYGTCFGHGSGTGAGDTAMVDGTAYYTGATCKGDGADLSKFTGLAWAGPVVGGWIMWNPDDNTSVPGGTLIISPPNPRSLAYFERQSFSVKDSKNKPVSAKWYVGEAVMEPPVQPTDIPGGNEDLGYIKPMNTAKNESATYTAPTKPRKVRVVAASTESSDTPAQVPVTVQEPYTLTCTPVIGTNDITISWKANYTDPSYPTYAHHVLRLFNYTMNDTQICANETAVSGSGSCKQTGLTEGTTYSYILKGDYDSGYHYRTTYASCTAGGLSAATKDTPTETHAYGNSATTIYVNWKDNTTTTAPYHFEIQRMKLTPATSTDVEITRVTANTITLKWTNITSSTPYRNYYERSTEVDPDSRFNATADNGNPIDRSLFSSKIDGSSNPYTTVPLPYTLDDNGVTEATTYYYRLRACTSVNDGNIADFYVPDTALRGISTYTVGKPSPACSPYTSTMKNSIGKDVEIATTTPPYAPTNLTAVPISTSQVRLQWTDNSEKETGFILYVYKNGTALSKSGQLIGKHQGTGTVTYTVSNLAPNTTYNFEVRAYYDYTAPDGSAGRALSDFSNSAGGVTDVTVQTAVNPSVGGTVRFNTGTVCPTNRCTETYSYSSQGAQASVTLTALPSSGYGFTTWEGDFCSNSTNPTCSFTVVPDRGTPYVAANFARNSGVVQVTVATASGTVTSAPPGVQCDETHPSTCTYAFTVDPINGTQISLSAVPKTDNVFDSWSGGPGDCTTANKNTTCSFLLNGGSAAQVSALFKPAPVRSPRASILDAAANLWNTITGSLSRAEHPNRAAAAFFDGLKTAFNALVEKTANTLDRLNQFTSGFGSLAGDIIKKHTPVASGGDILDEYFKKFDKNDLKVPVYKDTELEPDTVYLYRVRVVYDDGSGRVTPWDKMGAAKTLRDDSGPTLNSPRPICTRNSYCDFSIQGVQSSYDPLQKPERESSLQQCAVNADCRNVGRAGQTYQER